MILVWLFSSTHSDLRKKQLLAMLFEDAFETLDGTVPSLSVSDDSYVSVSCRMRQACFGTYLRCARKYFYVNLLIDFFVAQSNTLLATGKASLLKAAAFLNSANIL